MGKKIVKIVSLLLAIITVMSLIACIPVKVDAQDKAEMTAEPEPITEPEPTAEPVSPLIPMQEIKPEPAAEVAPEINPAGTETTEPVATETPAEPVDPNAAKKNTDAEIEAMVTKYCERMYKNGYDAATMKDYFTYAQMPDKSDWTKINKNLTDFYTFFPYNMHCADLGNNASQFMTNKQLVEQLGKDKVRDYGKKAFLFADFTASNYPDQMDSKTLNKQFTDCGLPADKAHQYAEQKLAYYNAYNFEREAWIAYDDLLVYRDAEGYIRARIEYNLILRNGSDDYMLKNGYTNDDCNTWIGTVAEVKIATDTEGNITDMEIIPLGDMQVWDKQGQKNLTRLFDAA